MDINIILIIIDNWYALQDLLKTDNATMNIELSKWAGPGGLARLAHQIWRAGLRKSDSPKILARVGWLT